MSYRVELSSGAARRFLKLPQRVQERLKPHIDRLEIEPRPHGCEKLQGGGFRVRVGDYRVVYLVDDVARILTITNVGHRKGVYKGR